MNLGQLQVMVSTLAGDETNVQFSTAQINQYINWAQMEVARRLELMQSLIVATTLDSAFMHGGVSLPNAFKQELHVLWNNQPITRINYADYYGYGGSPGTENATYYTIENISVSGPRMLFWPYQNPGRTGLDIDIYHVAYPADMVSSVDNCTLPLATQETVCLMALSRCKLQENDYAAYKLVNQDVAGKLMELSSLLNDSSAFSYPVVRSDPMVLDG
jgi:hypothetical protein